MVTPPAAAVMSVEVAPGTRTRYSTSQRTLSSPAHPVSVSLSVCPST
jgi:hypothetical protein